MKVDGTCTDVFLPLLSILECLPTLDTSTVELPEKIESSLFVFCMSSEYTKKLITFNFMSESQPGTSLRFEAKKIQSFVVLQIIKI